jgi:hypothetical protein
MHTDDDLDGDKCTVKSTENRHRMVEQHRSLHWTGVVPGPTAIAMAENIERIMAMSSDVAEPAAVEEGQGPDEQKKPKGTAKAKAKAKPKAAPDLRRIYISALAAVCLEWVTIMSDVKARLAP